jgi:glucose-1-phosphate adenylyltransferase
MNFENDRHISQLTKNTMAIVLAGGRGTRLKDLTKWRAKPAVPFGGKFRIIDFPLSNCINSGIRKISIVTQYKSHSLIRHIQRAWDFSRGILFGEFIELMPASQQSENWYSGTADAVFQNLHIIRAHDPEYILILAGDHIYKMDYGPMIAEHVKNNADMTVGCLEVPLDMATSFGVMSINEQDKVIRFAEKPSQPEPTPNDSTKALASMGIYVFNAKFLYEQLDIDAQSKESKHDFGMNIIPSIIDQHDVFAYRFRDVQKGEQAYWRDVGTLEAFWEANIDLVSVTPQLDVYDTEWPIWTNQLQLPPAKFVFDDDDRRGMAVDSIVSGGCIISGAKVKGSLLFSNVRIESHSFVTDSVILPDVKIGENCRITKAVIDRRAVIPDDTVIGENLEEDAKRFYVSESGIVLVTPDMLGQR